MVYVGTVQRWELYWADLEPAVGSEQAGSSRPVLVVSSDRANAAFRVVTVLPLTKLEGKGRPPRVMDDADARLRVEVGILNHLGIEFEES